jgi:nitrite reductase/ring-hydroxylating ferredoxin subunit
MERRQFLESLGIGAAFVLTATCLQSCKKDDTGGTTPTTTGIDFTLNIDDAANSSLKVNGGFVISNGVVVAKDKNGNFVAATQTCSHEGFKQVTFDNAKNEFMCSRHGARFDTLGKGLNSEASKGLTVYKTTLTGSSLRVFS